MSFVKFLIHETGKRSFASQVWGVGSIDMFVHICKLESTNTSEGLSRLISHVALQAGFQMDWLLRLRALDMEELSSWMGTVVLCKMNFTTTK